MIVGVQVSIGTMLLRRGTDGEAKLECLVAEFLEVMQIGPMARQEDLELDGY